MGGPKLIATSKATAAAYMQDRVRMPPIRSAVTPPSGRTREPANTQAAEL